VSRVKQTNFHNTVFKSVVPSGLGSQRGLGSVGSRLGSGLRFGSGSQKINDVTIKQQNGLNNQNRQNGQNGQNKNGQNQNGQNGHNGQNSQSFRNSQNGQNGPNGRTMMRVNANHNNYGNKKSQKQMSEVTISVCDQAVCLSRQSFEKIFNTRSCIEEGRSSGLGLVLARDLISLHGG
jgi:hypothetical protein